jgi:hypothetical protein
MNPNKPENRNADQKTRERWSFIGVFSKQTQTRIDSDHDQELHHKGVRSDPKSLFPPKSIPMAPISQELEGSPQFHKRRGREKPRTENFRISSRIKN